MIAPEDRGLGRVKFHDPRSRNYAYAAVAPTVSGITYKYYRPGLVLDQGREGACVGFSGSQELATSPVRVAGITDAWASDLYHEIQGIDREQGNNFDSGATTLSGAKALQRRGYITEYRWAFSMEEIKAALLSEGPVLIGIRWLDGMYSTLPNGRVTVSGNVVGGHAILLNGWTKSKKLVGDDKPYEYYRWINSWGPDYGIKGHGYLRAEDLANLMSDGEALVPMGRKKITP